MTWTDVPATAPDGISAVLTPWARVTIQHNEVTQSLAGEAGTRRFGRHGTLFVQIFSPLGQGQSELYTLAQAVNNGFADARECVWFRNIRTREAKPSGAFEQINVLTDFTYDDVR